MTWLASNEFKGLNPALLDQMRRAEDALHWVEDASARDLARLATSHLSVNPDVADAVPAGLSALALGDMSHADLAAMFVSLFPTGTDMASNLADQIQLCRAFSDPEAVVDDVAKRVEEAAQKFPRSADDLKVGDNKGDVLDPFILAANFELLSNGDLARTIETSLSHKVLMKIEDLVGNMHQNVLGAMRGNFLIPEPQRGLGGTKEIIQPYVNPFPGADIGQIPAPEAPDSIRLFQVKSKTGSATGGYGERLGRQLRLLEQTYGARTFYVAIVGNTLRGHRSKGAVLRESPSTAVLVGDAALAEISRCASGAELLLRTYRRAFRSAASQGTYDFETYAHDVLAVFQLEAEEARTDLVDAWLRKSMAGPRREQDSRVQDRTER